MRKILTYLSLTIASIVIVLGFVTAKNYIQLSVAIVFYPLIVYFILKTLRRGAWQENSVEQTIAIQPEEDETTIDVDKRSFLKLIGASGLSLLFYWIFTNRVRGPLLGGGATDTGTVSIEDVVGQKINPAEKQLTDGYEITEIDDSIIAYYGFTHKDNSWFIMRLDTDTGSFRYSRGNSDFAKGWTGREQLKYDYYVNAF